VTDTCADAAAEQPAGATSRAPPSLDAVERTDVCQRASVRLQFFDDAGHQPLDPHFLEIDDPTPVAIRAGFVALTLSRQSSPPRTAKGSPVSGNPF
jgi:hypothetical protein